MVELIGDYCEPNELIVPPEASLSGSTVTMSGTIIMSGSKLNFYTGSDWELVTSG